MEAFSEGRWIVGGGRGARLPDDPWQEKQAGGASGNLWNSSVEKDSPGGTVGAIRRIKQKGRNG